MREERIGGLTLRMAGGTDGHGDGDGPVVLLLHGWAAPGDDLVPLWEGIDAPRGTRFLFPQGPLSLNMGFGESRAWWLINVEQLNQDVAGGRPRNLSREVPKGLAEARERILALLAEAEARLGLVPEKTILGGFSQGAMLSCDVALRTDLPFAGIALLSGSLLARDEWVPLMPKRKGLRVLQSHGTMDQVLPVFLAEQLRDFLMEAGVAVEWVNFVGGHEISEGVLERLGTFSREVLST